MNNRKTKQIILFTVAALLVIAFAIIQIHRFSTADKTPVTSQTAAGLTLVNSSTLDLSNITVQFADESEQHISYLAGKSNTTIPIPSEYVDSYSSVSVDASVENDLVLSAFAKEH